MVGTDYRSVSFVNDLSAHVLGVCETYLKGGEHAFPSAILISLRPKDEVSFQGDYQVHLGGRGQVRLDFNWHPELSLEALCRGIVEAHVIRYAIFNYGPRGHEEIRFWAISALGARSYISLRPAQQVTYANLARHEGVPAIVPLLQLRLAEAGQTQVPKYSGYWVLQALRAQGLDRTAVGVLVERAVIGDDISFSIENRLRSVETEESPALELEVWWELQMQALLSVEFELFETMDVSLDWINQLTDFDAYRDAGGELKNLHSLWKHRDDDALRTILAARAEIIRLRLVRVNPAYFNAAKSLGVLYQTVLDGEQAHEFMHAFTVYLSDFEDTKRLHIRTAELLDEN